jgi:hypothetical protein
VSYFFLHTLLIVTDKIYGLRYLEFLTGVGDGHIHQHEEKDIWSISYKAALRRWNTFDIVIEIAVLYHST